jgi:hypothetical protein
MQLIKHEHKAADVVLKEADYFKGLMRLVMAAEGRMLVYPPQALFQIRGEKEEGDEKNQQPQPSATLLLTDGEDDRDSPRGYSTTVSSMVDTDDAGVADGKSPRFSSSPSLLMGRNSLSGSRADLTDVELDTPPDVRMEFSAVGLTPGLAK